MTTRSLRSSAPGKPMNRIRDPHERMEMTEYIQERECLPDDEEGIAAAQDIADRLTLFERTILDIEMREKTRAVHTSSYDPFKQSWEGL